MKGIKVLITTLTITSAFYFSSCALKPSTTTTNTTTTTPDTSRSVSYYYKLGLANLENGNMSQALFYLKKAYNINPNDYQVLNALGIAYARVGEFKKAEEMLKKAISVNSNKGEAYTNLGVLYASQKKYSEAIKYLEKAVSIDEYKNKDKALFNLALIYLKIGNPAKYEEYMRKSIAYNPYNTPAYVSLGNYYLKNKRYLDAYDVYLTALSNGLETPEIMLGLGKTHFYLRNYDKARYYLNKALNMSKNNPLLKQEAETYLAKIKKRNMLSANVNKTTIVDDDFFIKPPKKESSKKSYTPKKSYREPKKDDTIDFSNLPPARKSVKAKKYNPTPTPQKKYYPQVKAKPKPQKKEIISYGFNTSKKKKAPKLKYRYYLQIGVFSNYNNALRTKRRVAALGEEAKIITKKIGTEKYYIVIIGFFKTSTETKVKKAKLVKKNPFFRKAIIKYLKEGT